MTDLLDLVGVTADDITEDTDESCARAARAYAESNLPVICLHAIDLAGRCTCGRPDCASPGKHPRSAHGLHDATTDVDLVTTWWQRRPHSNVGVRPVPGVIVLDVDPRNGGTESLAALLAEHGPLPRTLVAETGSGGAHVWFGFQGVPPGKIGAGLDVKASSGYLVAPPSLHASGGRYRWVRTWPIAPAPTWLRARMAPVRRAPRPRPPHASRSVTGLVRFVESAVEGGRHGALVWAARRAAIDGLDLAEIEAAGLAIGLPEREVESIIRWGETFAPEVSS